MPYNDHDFIAALKGEKDSFLWPPIGRLYRDAAALDLGNVPTFCPNDLKTDVDVVAALDTLIGWLRSKQQPASADAASALTLTDEGDAALAAYLADHPDATEDETRDAVNAALPSGVRAWSLDRLRKNPTWQAHVNRRIGEYMDANPDATVEQIAVAVGYSGSTVHGSNAYDQRLPARKERKAQEKAKQDRQRRKGRRDTLWRIVRARVREYVENDSGKLDADALRSYLLQCQSEAAWVEEDWGDYVQSLTATDFHRLLNTDWTRRRNSSQEEDAGAQEEEDARIKASVRAYQRRRDNMRD